jgi:hypothetical protein
MHQQRFKKIMTEFLGSQPMLTLTGTLGIIFGLLIVVSHNIWTSNWVVLVTLIGWFIFLQGILRLFFPATFVKWVKHLVDKTGFQVWSWMWLLIGLFLIWIGFTR